MDQTVTIYGASDDLIEVEGDVPGCEEFSAYDKPGYVELSTGQVYSVEYTPAGVWTVNEAYRRPDAEPVKVLKEPHGEEEDPEPYTDTLRVTGPIKWVEFWPHWPPTHDDRVDKIGRAVEDGLTKAQSKRIFAALRGR